MLIKHDRILFKIAWISLAITGAGILVFGLITALFPGSNEPGSVRAIGMASIGMGWFGILIVLIPFRQHERWAWFALWYYPVFWLVHFIDRLPPGNDWIHQVVFIVLSLAGLLLSIGDLFPRAAERARM